MLEGKNSPASQQIDKLLSELRQPSPPPLTRFRKLSGADIMTLVIHSGSFRKLAAAISIPNHTVRASDLCEIAREKGIDPREISPLMGAAELADAPSTAPEGYWQARAAALEKDNARLRDYYLQIGEIMRSTVPKLDPSVPKYPKKWDTQVDEELAIHGIADTHVGESVRSYDTSGVSEYGIDIFKERCEIYKEAVDSLVNRHLRRTFPIKKAYVFMLGDMCFVPGQLVFTDDGAIPIEDISVGDLVLSHKGKFNRVVRLWKRQYEGKVILLKTDNTHSPIECTPEHPIYGITREKVWELYCRSGRSDRGRAAITNITKGAPVKKIQWQSVGSDDIEFIAAEDLSVGDFVAVPFDYLDDNNDSSDEIVLELPGRKCTHHELPKSVTLDDEFARLLGYYAAEGSIDLSLYTGKPLRATLSFNKNEVELIRDVKQIVKAKFGVECGGREVGNGYQVIIHDCRIAQLLAELCGHDAQNKKAPVSRLLAAGRSPVLSFLAAYLDGDGHLSNLERGVQLGAVSISKRLISDCIELLYAVGVDCQSFRGKQRQTGFPNQHVPWRITIPGNHVGAVLNASILSHPIKELTKNTSPKQRIGNYLLLPISSVNSYNYSGEVYNLEVEHENSYNIMGTAVHNCTGEDVFPIQLARVDRLLLEQIFEGAYYLADVLRYLSSIYDDVWCYMVPGNHGTGTKTTTISTDHLLYTMMTLALRDQKNFHPIISDSEYCALYIDDTLDLIPFLGSTRRWNFCLTHGHQARGWMGMPWYGLDKMKRRISDTMGIVFDKVFTGHNHVTASTEGWESIGSWVGATGYSMGKQMASTPMQSLFGFHPKRGLTWRYNIVLGDEPKLPDGKDGLYTPANRFLDKLIKGADA